MVNNHSKKQVKESEFAIKLLEIVTSIYLVLIVTFYFLFPGFHGYKDITEDKWRLFCVFSLAFTCLILLLAVQSVIIGSFSLSDICRSFKHISIFDLLILLYLTISALSVIGSDNVSVAFWGGPRRNGYITILLYCVIFFIISKFGITSRLLVYATGIALILNNSICLLQFGGMNPLTLYPDGLSYYDANILYGSQFLGTLGNNDLQSAAISLLVPMLLCVLLFSKDKRRIFLLVPVITSIIILAKAEVSAGMISLAMTSLLLSILRIGNNVNRKRYIIIAAMLIVLFFVFIFCFGSIFTGTIYEISMLMHGNIDDAYGSSRIYIWKAMMDIAKKNVLLGVGPDTIALNTDAVYSWFNYELNVNITNIIDNAHNEYLEILVGQGCIALLIYMLFLVLECIQCIAHRNDIIVCALGLGIMGYCIQAFFGINSPITTPYLWIAMGLLDRRLRELSIIGVKNNV